MVYRFFSRQIGSFVELHARSNVKRISMHVKKGTVCLSVPPYSVKYLYRTEWRQNMVDMAVKLLQKYRMVKALEPKFELDVPVVTPHMTIVVKRTDVNRKDMVVNRYDIDRRIMTLEVSEDADMADDILQHHLRLSVRKRLKQVAEIVLLPRLMELSLRHGFKMYGCSFGCAFTRWGSCSSRGKIILSGFLCLLSDDLIDYVIVHELCHLKYMDHGPKFKALLHSFFDDYGRREKELKIKAGEFAWLMCR